MTWKQRMIYINEVYIIKLYIYLNNKFLHLLRYYYDDMI